MPYPDSFMEWMVGASIPKMKQRRARSKSPMRRVVVHVETTDSEYTTDDSTDDEPASEKKVRFEGKQKLKPALKKPEKQENQEKESDDDAKSSSTQSSKPAEDSEKNESATSTPQKATPKDKGGKKQQKIDEVKCCSCHAAQQQGKPNQPNNQSQAEAQGKDKEEALSNEKEKADIKDKEKSQTKDKEKAQNKDKEKAQNIGKEENSVYVCSGCAQILDTDLSNQFLAPKRAAQVVQRNSITSPTTSQHNRTPSLTYNLSSNQIKAAIDRYLQARGGSVVIREDVVEGPSDPRPNAFFDPASSVLRVYHGPSYGNPYSTLVPHNVHYMPVGASPPYASHCGPYSYPPAMGGPQMQPPNYPNYGQRGSPVPAHAHPFSGYSYQNPHVWNNIYSPLMNNNNLRDDTKPGVGSQSGNQNNQCSNQGNQKNSNNNNNQKKSSGNGNKKAFSGNDNDVIKGQSNSGGNRGNSNNQNGGSRNTNTQSSKPGFKNDNKNHDNNSSSNDDNSNTVQANNDGNGESFWGVDNSNDNNQSNNTASAWGSNDNQNNLVDNNNDNNNDNNGDGDDTWGAPAMQASWGDPSAAQSTKW